MYQGLVDLHNTLRWVILILLVIAIVKAIRGMTARKQFTQGDKRIGLFLLIATHTNVLIGLYQWFAGPWGLKLIQNAGMSEVMKTGAYRFWAIEHITGMVIAAILITIGRGASKKNIPDREKHTRSFWFFLIALVIILASIPWPGRQGVGRPLIPGMHRSGAGYNS